METKSSMVKNKLYPVVDDEAKRNLVMFQAKESLRTRDGAVEMILHKLPTWEAQEVLIRKQQQTLKKQRN
jgi:hypothetical protein